MLFHLVRGSGAKGVSGIPPVRGAVIRPLLFAERREIEAFLRENGQDYVTDSSNLSDDYTRNRLRHSVLPMLRGINEQAGSASSCGRMRPASAGRRNAVCKLHFVRTALI